MNHRRTQSFVARKGTKCIFICMFHSQSGDVCRVEYDCQVLIPGFGFEAVRHGRFPASNHVAVYFISGRAVFQTRAFKQLSSTLTDTRLHTLSNTLSNTFEHVFQTRTLTRFKFKRISFWCGFTPMTSCFDGVPLHSAFVHAQFSIATLSRGGEWRADGPFDNHEKARCACIFTGHL